MRPESKKPDKRALLVMIKVNLGLGDWKLWVNAIVDSGSEVNIISRLVAKELNKDYPVMPLEEARCTDVNGNQGILTGKFSDVSLFQGSVVMNAALFVGSYKVNFQMLLGQPWIRGINAWISCKQSEGVEEGIFGIFSWDTQAKKLMEAQRSGGMYEVELEWAK
ncbi:hypothetical protein ARMGADRAFT_1030123 [Armillaria gallica]|uniref:Peptidase A2 domain-containing protein n=1 Tax=Armillaria gallica TaxID=47427 RepID=A0A2H3DHA6_ARMGA|nr:hypothetical protein ARMGADRAFT_1030123 [Armillaria gallica]